MQGMILCHLNNVVACDLAVGPKFSLQTPPSSVITAICSRLRSPSFTDRSTSRSRPSIQSHCPHFEVTKSGQTSSQTDTGDNRQNSTGYLNLAYLGCYVLSSVLEFG